MSEFQLKCEIVKFEQLTVDIIRLTVQAPEISGAARPGQFVMIRVNDGFDPLLRRPLSIHSISADKTCLTLLFKIVGRGTGILSRLEPGEALDIIGPLGRWFDLSSTRPVCLIGGGMGIAPLYFSAQQLAESGRSVDKDYILLGARNREELQSHAEEFSELGFQVLTATDDGSMGHHGFIPELLDPLLATVEQVFTCGPKPMMNNIVNRCFQAGVACQVSLETLMACGLGACLGCTVTGADGNYLHVCKQGPVFNSREVAWNL